MGRPFLFVLRQVRCLPIRGTGKRVVESYPVLPGTAPAGMNFALMGSDLQINGKDADEDQYLECEVGELPIHNAR
jgi:hypothetical protein